MTSIAELVTSFTTTFSSLFSLITGNWLLAAIVGFPLVLGVLAAIIGLFRRGG